MDKKDEPQSWNDVLDKDDLTIAYMVGYHKRDDEVRLLRAENERLREALTPSADTKADYIGEFMFTETFTDENGNDVSLACMVPWTTIKDIMAAIRARAALHHPRQDAEE